MDQGRVTILGIETSCDETAAAVAVGQLIDNSQWTIAQGNKAMVYRPSSISLLSNIVASQINLHTATGGVVPEVAARAHVEAILPVIQQALDVSPLEVRSNSNTNFLTVPPTAGPTAGRSNQSRQRRDDLTRAMRSIDAIAVTIGPGLVGSLLIGVETAKTLGYVFNKPIIPVNHLEGHIYANFVGEQLEVRSNSNTNFLTVPPTAGPTAGRSNQSRQRRDDLTSVRLPALVLIVSGGHTELILMKDRLQYELIGQTRDDAAGECFDKCARLLGLPYPGGPALSKLAEGGDSQAFDFPRPMIESDDFDFSFSGLKTAVFYKIRELEINKLAKTNSLIANLAASIQQAIVDVLVVKTMAAAKHYQAKTVMISGGVAANQLLRQTMSDTVAKQLPSVNYRQPNLDLATDNAGMIAIAGVYRCLRGDVKNWYDVGVDANASLA